MFIESCGNANIHKAINDTNYISEAILKYLIMYSI